ncbi:MAG: RES family NAD+ phosphorylase [Bacteroidales bacterium]|nr:RES family NAD+ phosphorylase [Bacteroidales bacterium]
MIVFRLSKTKYVRDLTGKGAEKAGGRWNSKGTSMIYTSATRALCTTELAVHLPLGIIPEDYSIVTIDIPDKFILHLKDSLLPNDWKSIPHSDSTQKIGDHFIKQNNSLVMRVPSAVVQDEFNFLINPNHPDIGDVIILSVKPFNFDERLFKK